MSAAASAPVQKVIVRMHIILCSQEDAVIAGNSPSKCDPITRLDQELVLSCR